MTDKPDDIPYDKQPCKAGEVVEVSPLVRHMDRGRHYGRERGRHRGWRHGRGHHYR